MANETPYLGSKISLISKAEIRYEGILYSIDANESTVALAKVKSFGTEHRPTAHPVPAREEIFEYIIFRGSDIKELHVCGKPPPPPPVNQAPNDPAIVQSSMSTGSLVPLMVAPYPSPNGAYSVQPLSSQVMAGPYHGFGHLNFSDHQFNNAPSTHSGSHGTTSPPLQFPRSNFPNYRQRKSSSCGSCSPSPVHKDGEACDHHCDDRSIVITRGGLRPHVIPPRGSYRGVSGGATRGESRSQSFYPSQRKDVFTRSEHNNYQSNQSLRWDGSNHHNRFNTNRDKDVYPPRRSTNEGFNGRQGAPPYHDFNRQFRGRFFARGYYNPMNGRRGMPRGGGPPRGYLRGGIGRPTRVGVLKFDSEFDFETSNAQFDKEQIEKELKEKLKIEHKDSSDTESGLPVETNGDGPEDAPSSFYDKNKSFFDSISCEALDRNGNRPNWREERKLNIETFGPRSANNMGYWYRGGRGRGYGRGYGGMINYQSMDNGYHSRGGYYRGQDRGWATNQYRGGRGYRSNWSKHTSNAPEAQFEPPAFQAGS